jgi:phospholipid/cholesterol/gamma-HCH transport system ATP-binding protein
MRRRIATARSLIYKPEVMLYDEPTTGLDPATCETICDLINDVKRLGVSAIFVTHNLKDAFEVGDRFLLLGEGRVVWQGPSSDLKNKPSGFIQDFFKGKETTRSSR